MYVVVTPVHVHGQHGKEEVTPTATFPQNIQNKNLVGMCGTTGRLPSAALPLVDIPPGSASMHWASVCMAEVHMMWQAHDGGPRADRFQAPAAALALSQEPALNLLSNTNASTQRAPIALEGTGCCVFSPHTRVQSGVCVEDGVGKAAMHPSPRKRAQCTGLVVVHR